MWDLTGAAGEEIELSLWTPSSAALVRNEAPLALVAGRAARGPAGPLDVSFVIDTSESTRGPSGMDIDGDGRVLASYIEPSAAAPGVDRESALAVEVGIARSLLDRLDASARVGLITFSGDRDPATPDAREEIPLTLDHASMRVRLEQLLQRGPAGGTHTAAGLEAGSALLSAPTRPETSERARRLLVLVTDGVANLPDRLPGPTEIAVRAAAAAASAGVRTSAYGLAAPETLYLIARAGGGVAVLVRDPREPLPGLVGIREVEVRNGSLGVAAARSLLTADGVFAALVPVSPCSNLLSVTARSGEQSREVRVSLTYASGEGEPLPAPLAELRAQLDSQDAPR